MTATFAAEIARNREAAERPGTVAAIVGVDPQNWTIARILLSDRDPAGEGDAVAYEVLHLAQPLLNSLPSARCDELPVRSRTHLSDADPFRAGTGPASDAGRRCRRSD
ncbi:hypothetical protein [Bradyrhizobium niftali]|uniref:hypothetical protein n=1 Tax=Bradyrhizobium niftali TaxID=2560055 RepID=UPI00384E4E66